MSGQRQADPEVPVGTLIVRGKPATTELGRLLRLVPLGGARALLDYHIDESFEHQRMALSQGPGRPVWLRRTERRLYTLVVVDGVIVGSFDDRYRGAIGVDLATGAQRWQTGEPPRADRDRYIDVEVGEGRVLHVTHGRLLEYRARDGELLHVVDGASKRGAAVNERWAAHRASDERVRGDPDRPEFQYVLRPRADLSRGRSLGSLSDVCIVDDRMYTIGAGGLLRHDLTRPAAPPVALAVELPRLAGFGRHHTHGAHDLLCVQGRVIGVDAAGGRAWEVDLGDLQIEGNAGAREVWYMPRSRWLPDHAVLLASRGDPLADDDTWLLQFDVPGRRVRRLSLAAWPRFGSVVLDRRRSLLLLEAREFCVLISVAGATGRVQAAVRIAGGDDRRVDVIDGESLWLSSGGGPELRGRRYLDERTRLHADTLRPLDGASAFTLHDVSAWAQAWLDTARPVATAARPVRPPPRSSPGRLPGWDLEELFAATRAAADVRDGRGTLLAWDRHMDAGGGWTEHALVVLERAGEAHPWVIAFMARGSRRLWNPWWERRDPDDPEPGHSLRSPADIRWEPLYAPQSEDPRILYLPRRPSAADLRRFLAGSSTWDPAGSLVPGRGKDAAMRAWIVDGEVMAADWRAAIGEAPDWGYAPRPER